MSLNTCTESGRLGKAAELRYTTTGVAVVTFSLRLTNAASNLTAAIRMKPTGLIA